MQNRNKILFGVMVAVLLIGGYFIYEHFRPAVPAKVEEFVEREDLNMAFTYTGGTGGYSFVQPPLTDAMKSSGIDSILILMDADEYSAYRTAPTGGETPKSMTIFVVKDDTVDATTTATDTPRVDRKTKLRLWAEENAPLTSFDRIQGEVEDVEIDGAAAIRYRADGLYPQMTYVAFYQDRYYLFVGQYDGEGDVMKNDFEALVRSVLFG